MTTILPLELGQVADPSARRALEQISLQWPRLAAVAAATTPPFVTTGSLAAGQAGIPNPIPDGFEVYFQDATMAASGFAWHLRYRAGSASPYKWEFVGGSDLLSMTGTSGATGSTGYVPLSPALTYTTPLAGEYYFRWGAVNHNTATVFNYAGLHSGGTVLVEAITGIQAGNYGILATECALGVGAGVAMNVQFKVSGGTGTFLNRYLAMRPTRVA